MTHSTFDAPDIREVHKATCRSKQVPFLPRKRISISTVIWSLLLGVAMVCPAVLFLAIFPVSPQMQQSNLKIALAPGIAILLHVCLGPLLEELVYRGLFLQLARRYLPVWLAIVLSSGVFAVTHLPRGLGTVVLAFPLGSLYAWMVVRSGSLYPGFLCHAVFNFAAMFVVAPLFGIDKKVLAVAPNTTFPHPLTDLFPAWWIVLSMVMVGISFVMLGRQFSRGDTVADANKRRAANIS